MNQVTSDLPDSFFVDEVAVAKDLEVDHIDLMRPLIHESNLSFKAWNLEGNASGIFQAMPSTLRGLGFYGIAGIYLESPGAYEALYKEGKISQCKQMNTSIAKAFCSLNADEQLKWMQKYFEPYKGKLVNGTAVYLAMFAPAMLAHANDANYVICAKDGTGGGGWLSPRASQLWYAQNESLDADKDGKISVSDLAVTIARADIGERWTEIVERSNLAFEDRASFLLSGALARASVTHEEEYASLL